MLLDVKECPSKVIGVTTAFVATPTTVVVKVYDTEEFCGSNKEAVAFVVARKAIKNAAAKIDATVILLIDLAISLFHPVMFALHLLCFMNTQLLVNVFWCGHFLIFELESGVH